MSTQRHLFTATLLVLLHACGGDPDPDAAVDLDGGTERDAGAINRVDAGDAAITPPSDASATDDTGPPDAGGLRVEISEPLTDIATAAPSIAIGVLVHGGTADRVEVHADDVPLAALSPPYRHIWDISTADERAYAVTAHAWQGDLEVVSEPRIITVDRSPPRVVSTVPVAGEPLDLSKPIVVTFDEPIDLDSVGTESRLGSDTGVVYDAVYSLDSTGTELRIELTGPDGQSSGDVTLDLAGIADPLGQAIAEETVRWPTPVWLLMPDPFPGVLVVENMKLRVAASGELIVAARVSPPGLPRQIRVARWNGLLWADLAAETCVPDPDGCSREDICWDMELSPDGMPVVAFGELPTSMIETTGFCSWTGTGWERDAGIPHDVVLAGIDLHIDAITGRRALAVSRSGQIRIFERAAAGWTEHDPAPPAAAFHYTRRALVSRDDAGSLRVLGPVGSDHEWRVARSGTLGWTESPPLSVVDAHFLGTGEPLSIGGCGIWQLTGGAWENIAGPGGVGCDAAVDASGARWVASVHDFLGFRAGAAKETSDGEFVAVGLGDIDISTFYGMSMTLHDGRPIIAVRAQPRSFIARLNYLGALP